MKEKKNRQKFEHNPPRPSHHVSYLSYTQVPYLFMTMLTSNVISGPSLPRTAHNVARGRDH